MIKKLLLLGLLTISVGAQAVLLKDGSSVEQKKVDRVYYTLKSLNQANNDNKQLLVADLLIASKTENRKLESFSRSLNHANPRNSEKDHEERLKYAIDLELCDKDGVIDPETAHVIMSAVDCWFYAPMLPFIIKVHSPVSWLWWTELFKKISKK